MANLKQAPLSIDEHAVAYLGLKAAAEDAKRRLDAKRDELAALALKNGSVPDSAVKSVRLSGDRYQITLSFGSSTSVDGKAVEKLQAALKAQGTPGLFKKLFQAKTTYITSPAAAVITDGWSTMLRALFARCTVVKPREPSLRVEKIGGRK